MIAFLAALFLLVACKNHPNLVSEFSPKNSVLAKDQREAKSLVTHETSIDERKLAEFAPIICETTPWKSATAAAEGDSQCVQVEPDVFLHTHWIRKKDAKNKHKPLLVFLHGGPGGTLNDYVGLDVFDVLKEKYDILFFTQRGSGLSSPLKDKNNLNRFTLSHHLRDINALVKLFSPDQKIVLMGHSYGAHLALMFSSQYPDKVLKTVALNGAANGAGFVMQSTIRMNLFTQIARKTLDTSTLNHLDNLELKGTLLNEDGRKISGLFNEYHEMLYTFSGINAELPNKLLAVAQANPQKDGHKLLSLSLDAEDDKNSDVLPTKDSRVQFPDGFVRFSQKRSQSQFSLNETQKTDSSQFNDILNQWIVCANLVTPQAIEKVTLAYRMLPILRRAERCLGFGALVETFDGRKQLTKIDGKVLLTSGTHDPLIPWVLQKEAHKIMTEAKKNSTWVVFEKTGHNPDEDSLCLEKSVVAFLGDELSAGSYICSKGVYNTQNE
jgi:pimeloyl-ACP methyl ester carboxylesterase